MPSPRVPNEVAARREAQALLNSMTLGSGPIELEALVAEQGLQVYETAEGFPAGAYGALIKNSPMSFCIMLSTRCPTAGHRRFTLAHELGHYFLPDHIDVLLAGAPAHFSRGGHFRGRKDWWEVEADTFAAELLVPTDLADSTLRATSKGLIAIRALVDRFDVSLSCAAVRYATMAHDPVLIVLSYGGTVEWTCYAGCVRDHRWARSLGRGDWAPRHSATALLTRSPALIEAGELRAMNDVLPTWVADAPVVPIKEEAVGLGSYGRVLTVLTCEHLPTPEAHEAMVRRREAGPRSWREGLRSWAWEDPDGVEEC